MRFTRSASLKIARIPPPCAWSRLPPKGFGGEGFLPTPRLAEVPRGATPMAELATLDVQQNLKETIAALTRAAEEVDAALKVTGNIPSAEVSEKLKLIGS